MISVTEALSLIMQNRPDTATETVALRDAIGRQLAQDVVAALTQPPLEASAMDGYAVSLEDIGSVGAKLYVIGEAPAGAPFLGTVSASEAVRIFTGGAVPDGADTIIIQENVEANGSFITVTEPQESARHIRRAGLDFRKGDILINSGTIISPYEIAVAAAAGHAELSVTHKLRVAILSGGDELVPPGGRPEAGQIINSNPYALAALIESWGHEALILAAAKDSLKSISNRIHSAKTADVIVPVGGASVGDHDHMRTAFRETGLEMIFEKIAVRPGKPTWFGLLGGRPVLGLPGNPASAMVCAQLFVQPMLTGKAAKLIKAKLSENVQANGPRETYQRAVVTVAEDGSLSVTPLPMQDSGLMTPFLTANGLLRLPVNTEAKNIASLAEVILIKPLI